MFDEEAKDSRSASLHAACGSSSGSGFGESYSLSNPSIHAGEDIPQPTIFNGKLKGYQLKGMNWLANLYEQVCRWHERPVCSLTVLWVGKSKICIHVLCVCEFSTPFFLIPD